MRTRDIKEGRFYSNGNRTRLVCGVQDEDDVPDGCVQGVRFRECQDGPNSYRLTMPLSEFAKWATMECTQYFKRAEENG